MAASPDAGDARCAPLGVMRALSRVVVLGGLVVAGWLLGSGIGLASDELGPSGAGPVQLASDPGTGAARPNDGPGGQRGGSHTVTSAVTTVRSILSLPGQPTQPPVRPGLVQPIVNALNAPTPLATLSGPAKYGAGIRSQTPVNEPVTVPPAEPAVRAAAATAPAPTLGPPTVRTTVGHAAPARAAAPTTKPFARQLALGNDPAAPVPASPPASTTSSCMTASTGSGAGTKSTPDIAVNGSWATAGLASTHRLLCRSASDLPRSPAAQPSTSPD
ncbi:MAG: hypothetical protein ACRDQ4_10180 [Pseudonocardiaceae bacterium]